MRPLLLLLSLVFLALVASVPGSAGGSSCDVFDNEVDRPSDACPSPSSSSPSIATAAKAEVAGHKRSKKNKSKMLEPEANCGHRRYNKLDAQLENLLKKISIREKDKERELYVRAFKELEGALGSVMREADPVFNALFKRFHPTGSSHEGLRITCPNEFDVNVIIQLPLQNSNDIKIQNCGHAGHIRIHSERDIASYYSQGWFTARYGQIRTEVSKWWLNGFLNREKVKSWMQSTVVRAVSLLNGNKNLDLWRFVTKIETKASGPAFTLEVTAKGGGKFSVDLVPTLQFPIDALPRGIRGRAMSKASVHGTRDWYAVPKGPTNSSLEVWRASLWDLEKDMISGLYHFKPLIRILKRLRDVQNWQGLASYYIKTSVMLKLERIRDKREYFRSGLGQLLMLGLKDLEDDMRGCRISFFWDPDHNLLERMSEQTCINIANRLRFIQRSFEKSLTDDSEDPMQFFNGRDQPVINVEGTPAPSYCNIM